MKIKLLYPMEEEVGGALINNAYVASLIIRGGPRAVEHLPDISKAESAILLGTAGAIASELSLGDIVGCRNFISVDGRTVPANSATLSLVCEVLEKSKIGFHIGTSVTVPTYGYDIGGLPADIVDGEDFYIADFLQKRNISLLVVRVVSDLISEHLSLAELLIRIPTYGSGLREKFLIPFLKGLGLES